MPPTPPPEQASTGRLTWGINLDVNRLTRGELLGEVGRLSHDPWMRGRRVELQVGATTPHDDRIDYRVP